MMKRPFDEKKEIKVYYDFINYFSDIMNGRKAVLEKKASVIRINPSAFDGWDDFARIIAWYGRKNGATTYLKETE